MKKKISAVMVAKNEAENMVKCLEKIKWADEIVILDNGSTDNTIEIAKKYTKKIFVDDSPFNDLLYNKVIEKAEGEWIFLIDADEEATPELVEEIQTIISAEQEKKGYYIPFKHFFLGDWLRYGGWYPSYLIRLIKKEFARVDFPVHRMFELKEGEAGYLKGHILHYGDKSLAVRTRKIDLYSTIKAQELYEQGIKVNFFSLFMPSFIRFAKIYLLRLGFLDGMRGFIRTVFLAYTSFLERAKLYELKINEKKRNNMKK